MSIPGRCFQYLLISSRKFRPQLDYMGEWNNGKISFQIAGGRQLIFVTKLVLYISWALYCGLYNFHTLITIGKYPAVYPSANGRMYPLSMKDNLVLKGYPSEQYPHHFTSSLVGPS